MAEGLALIIEDSQTQARIIGRMLDGEDWEYLTVKTIAEGLTLIVKKRPTLIFVDIFLGEDNSLLHLEQIRDLAPQAAIAIMTAGSKQEALDETLAAARRSQVDFVLRKPFSSKQLGAILQFSSNIEENGRKPCHALVVDDSLVVGHLTSQILSDGGYRVSMASSMEDALANVDIAHVDLIVSDIFMPGMGGLKGIKVLKATWPTVKVLAMSAGLGERITSENAISAAVKAGADAEIRKPFTHIQLMNTVIDMMA